MLSYDHTFTFVPSANVRVISAYNNLNVTPFFVNIKFLL